MERYCFYVWCITNCTGSFLGRNFTVIEKFNSAISWSWRQYWLIGMKFQTCNFLQRIACTHISLINNSMFLIRNFGTWEFRYIFIRCNWIIQHWPQNQFLCSKRHSSWQMMYFQNYTLKKLDIKIAVQRLLYESEWISRITSRLLDILMTIVDPTLVHQSCRCLSKVSTNIKYSKGTWWPQKIFSII